MIGLGAALGSIGRYLITVRLKKVSGWPLATLLINLSGSFVLGLLFGLNLSLDSYKVLGIGIIGGYTTFSTFNVELLALHHSQEYRLELAYALTSYLGGLLLVILGFWSGKAF
jgi:CrcB protein